MTQLFGGSGAPYDLVATGDPRNYPDLATPAGLATISGSAQGIGPDKGLVIPRKADGTLGDPSPLVRDAHAQGLVVHPYTFRAENQFLPVDYRTGTGINDYGRGIAEQVTFLAAGTDGLFTDQPDVGVIARAQVAEL